MTPIKAPAEQRYFLKLPILELGGRCQFTCPSLPEPGGERNVFIFPVSFLPAGLNNNPSVSLPMVCETPLIDQSSTGSEATAAEGYGEGQQAEEPSERAPGG